MRFNYKELSVLLQKCPKSSLSGWLYLSVNDFTCAIEHSTDHFVRRWCCIQHNLLLTSKQERGPAETVLVLEGHSAKICHSGSHGYGFVVRFTDTSSYHFYCTDREVAVDWVQTINNTGVFNLKKQWSDLQERYDSLVAQQNRVSKCYDQTKSSSYIEVSIKAYLPLNSPTNHTFASVYTWSANTWILSHQTESIDHTLTPSYSKTIQFNIQDTKQTKLKFCINDISSMPAKILGSATSTLSDLLSQSSAGNHGYNVPIFDNYNSNAGSITIKFHKVNHTILDTMVQNIEFIEVNATRAFVFDNLHVSEQMWDVDFSVSFPLAYINFLLEKKENMLNCYEEFTTLDPIYDCVIEKMIGHYNKSMDNLLRCKKFLENYTGPMYKRSVEKKDPGWEYVPTNLAIYTLGVNNQDDSGLKERNYYTTTVGACSAHNLGYKNGLHASLKQSNRETFYTSKHDEIMIHINTLHSLWQDIERCKCSLIDAVALEQNDLYDMAVILTTKISDLTEFCKLPLITMGEEMMKQAETQSWNVIRERNWSSPETTYVWDGTRYRERCVSESTDELETDIRVHITTFITLIEKKEKGVGAQLLHVLASLEPLITVSHQGLTFLSLLEEQKIFYSFFENNLDIEIRFNQCYCQVLTILYTTFYISVMSAINDKDWDYFKQLDCIGYLIHFQSLLSTHGPEITMLEDYIVSISMLAQTTIQFEPSDQIGAFTITGSYHKVKIIFGVGSGNLVQLIKLGSEINIYPVLLTLGVNEQQLYAETFGTTSLQDVVNTEGLCNIELYNVMYKQYIEARANTECIETSHLQILEDLMCILTQCVKNKVPKNVQMLVTCHQIVCLMKGGRVTSCKSAKDRTAMSVTYESICSLQDDFGLDVKSNGLAALRSHGVRPLNCKKNTGDSKYAFNALQLKILPKEYRPPVGSYGGKVT